MVRPLQFLFCFVELAHRLTYHATAEEDFFGSWYPVTGANAPLYDQEWGDEDVKGFSVDGCVRNWMKGGASPSRINIGLPFYGRSFKKAKGLNETHEGNDMDTWYMDDGSPQYFNIIDKLSEYTSVRHEPTKTQYAYRESESGGLVSYDDEEAICDKTEYVSYSSYSSIRTRFCRDSCDICSSYLWQGS
jgi:chitinase